jgi:hypothetical protein
MYDKFKQGLSDMGSSIRNAAYDAIDSTVDFGKSIISGDKGSSQLAMKVLMAKGWTKVQAAGIAANIAAESGFKFKAVGDGGRAYGIAQWHPDRQLRFKSVFHKDIRESTFEEQVAFVDWELRNTEKKAGDLLRKATSPAQAAAIVEQKYERSKLGLSGGVQRERVNAAMGYAGYSDEDIESSSSLFSKGVNTVKDVFGFGDQKIEAVPEDQLRIKSAESTAGGKALPGTMALARVVQAKFDDKITKFSAFNDAYHQKNSPESGHTRGLKFDFGLKNPSEATAIAEQIEGLGKISGTSIKVMDEYANLSKKGTGGHIDVGFKDALSANKFAAFLEGAAPTTEKESRETNMAEEYPDKPMKPMTALAGELPEIATAKENLASKISPEVPTPSPVASVAPVTAPNSSSGAMPEAPPTPTPSVPMVEPPTPAPAPVVTPTIAKTDLSPLASTYAEIGTKAEKQRNDLLAATVRTNQLLEAFLKTAGANQPKPNPQPMSKPNVSKPKQVDPVINLSRAY